MPAAKVTGATAKPAKLKHPPIMLATVAYHTLQAAVNQILFEYWRNSTLRGVFGGGPCLSWLF